MAAQKENKYLIVNRKRIERYFKEPMTDERKAQKRIFEKVLAILDNGDKYIVINQNEPYAEGLWEFVLQCEDLKNDAKQLAWVAKISQNCIKRQLTLMECTCDPKDGETVIRVFGKDHQTDCPMARFYVKCEEVMKVYKAKYGDLPKEVPP